MLNITRHKIIYSILLIVLLVAIYIFLLPGILHLIYKNEKPINDADLRLPVLVFKESNNAYYDLQKLDGLAPQIGDNTLADLASEENWHKYDVEKILAQNQQILLYYEQAANRVFYQSPKSSRDIAAHDDDALSFQHWRSNAKLSTIKAKYLARQGKHQEAIDEFLNSISIGHKLINSQCNLYEYLVGLGLKKVGLDALRQNLSLLNLNTAQSKALIVELDQYYQNEEGLVLALKREYDGHVYFHDLLAKGDTKIIQEAWDLDEKMTLKMARNFKNRYYYQPNKTKSIIADYYRHMIDQTTEVCGRIEELEIPKLSKDGVTIFAKKNTIGKTIHNNTSYMLTDLVFKKCFDDLDIAATQTNIAIKNYYQSTNTLPENLEALTPLYLDTLPQDPFDGKKIKYSLDKRSIYSVGKTMQDLGGSIGEDPRSMDNPTYQMSL